MPDDIPTYLWGDTIRLRMKVEHEENLVAVWAIFRKEGETFEFSLRLRTSYNLRLMEWHGERRISEVILEATVDRSNQVPGTYDLMAVRATPRPPPRRQQETGGGLPGVRLPRRGAPSGSRTAARLEAAGRVLRVPAAFVGVIHPSA